MAPRLVRGKKSLKHNMLPCLCLPDRQIGMGPAAAVYTLTAMICSNADSIKNKAVPEQGALHRNAVCVCVCYASVKV